MTRPAGNRKLKAARLAKGYGSQQALADALNAAARDLGLRGVSIGERQVRRWESEDPPWPHSHHQQLLTHVLQLSAIHQLSPRVARRSRRFADDCIGSLIQGSCTAR
jgi:hypothetical protein